MIGGHAALIQLRKVLKNVVQPVAQNVPIFLCIVRHTAHILLIGIGIAPELFCFLGVLILHCFIIVTHDSHLSLSLSLRSLSCLNAAHGQ